MRVNWVNTSKGLLTVLGIEWMLYTCLLFLLSYLELWTKNVRSIELLLVVICVARWQLPTLEWSQKGKQSGVIKKDRPEDIIQSPTSSYVWMEPAMLYSSCLPLWVHLPLFHSALFSLLGEVGSLAFWLLVGSNKWAAPAGDWRLRGTMKSWYLFSWLLSCQVTMAGCVPLLKATLSGIPFQAVMPIQAVIPITAPSTGRCSFPLPLFT